MLGAPGLALRHPLLQRRPRFPVVEACGRWEAPASRVLKLWREGLEKDFNPLTARLLVPRALPAASMEKRVCNLSWAGSLPRAADCW